ncbi:conserved Plasmodium protein, unknown function [Plasmodium berghei]|uniref:Symplekin C-terminal domain-containing protein n=2 Tax=Plasmodium berghei TaxID=5821 RepID=A0A509AQM2_PLABA|nr:conserved Plasmodium protein, unknown function [Plasmodium berghei ANKA]CXJ20735.1 conserved Plasmodium protein, unknown function [Plasmodium berghei]SCM26555.1 conserved Plasmodium protein, unknown function [Plasmodium berghei]SCN28517.1 conserved Plasmodium protein, unknown function [Plasmodium berghei]SCO62707.1 conserved Plasmodium protein, unknown function [Plasmodium berghei]SCO64268.1 conserved Plasmodium protein, unknown function [Plasmodium berghei]|eukprot:XP_034424163.1 conserved Plasmodium protein, unknown function [Plasmodium berghei ANKA]
MLKIQKKGIGKIIHVLESNEESEDVLITNINEIEQIFLKCFRNENKKNRKIINTYIIPYISILLERINNGSGYNDNHIFKEKLMNRILTFFFSLIRINKNYSYLIISYFVNLIEEKHYLVKIIEYLKKTIIYLLKGLLFVRASLYNDINKTIENVDGDPATVVFDEKQHELDQIKEGFHSYVILKSKIFNILLNYNFEKYIKENPYKYDIIKNLMLIFTKEILYFFHILRNKKNIFKEILSQEKYVHHIINEMLDITYLNDVSNKVNLKNFDEIILIWLEQNIRLFNDLILFSISKHNNNIGCLEKKTNAQNSTSMFSFPNVMNKLKNNNNKNNKQTCKVKKENNEACEDQAELENHNKDTKKMEFVNKLIYYFEEKKNSVSENELNGDDNIKNKKQLLKDEKKKINNDIGRNATYDYVNKIDEESCEKYMMYENIYYKPPNCNLDGKEEIENKEKIKYLINEDCLISNINEITTDNIIFLTHLMRNIFYLIRIDPFILNFFIQNIFALIKKLMFLKDSIKNIDTYASCNNPNKETGKKGNKKSKKNEGNNEIKHSKEDLFDCLLYYIKNELYILICKIDVNFPFYYSYITILLNIMGIYGTTEELKEKKKNLLNSVYINKELDKELYGEDDEEEEDKEKRKLQENFHLNNQYLQNKNVLKKEGYGYKKLRNEQVDIMSYLKVKMNENDSKNRNFKKEEKENIFINQVIKKLYLTNFNLNKKYYEQLKCFKKINLVDIVKNSKINSMNCETELSQEYYYSNNHSNFLKNIKNEEDTTSRLRKTKNSTSHICNDNKNSKVNITTQLNKYDEKKMDSEEMKEGNNKRGYLNNMQSMEKNFVDLFYKDMYTQFLNSNLKYYGNIKNNDTILGSIELYYFLLFSQIINNNLENNVQVLGENIFIKKINNLKIINNIVKRIILNNMMRENLKFFFLTLYIIKVNSTVVFTGTNKSTFLNYSLIFKMLNNILFYSYIQEKSKMDKNKDPNIECTTETKKDLNVDCKTNFKKTKPDYTLGYALFCYNYLNQIKNKLKNNEYAYRSELQKKNYKFKCLYGEIFNIIIYFLHNDNLLTNNRDQYIKTFIEKILETPKLPFTFFIYLIMWLNNIHTHIDYKGYINNTSCDNLIRGKNESDKNIMNKIKFSKNLTDKNIEESKMETSMNEKQPPNYINEFSTYENAEINHNEKNKLIKDNDDNNEEINVLSCDQYSEGVCSYFDVETDKIEMETLSNDESIEVDVNIKEKTENIEGSLASDQEERDIGISSYIKRNEERLSKFSCEEEEIKSKRFNINYYIRYSYRSENSSNYYIFSFSLISNLLKKNSNIKSKKTVLAIYINTLYNSNNEIKTLLKKLITASKGIYNNTLNFYVYTKRIYNFYHKLFILFLLYICNIYIPHLKNDILFFSHFAFYLWPIELINFIHNFLIENFSFFYNDLLAIFSNYKNIQIYEQNMRSLKNFQHIQQKLNEYTNNIDNPDIFQTLEAFLKETDFFNTKKEETEEKKNEQENKIKDEKIINNIEEEKECLQKNEISQKILIEEIFIFLFLKTLNLIEDNKLFEKIKKSNIFINLVSIDYVNSLCNFVISNIEQLYEKNKDEFWAQFSSLLQEVLPDDIKIKTSNNNTDDKGSYSDLREIITFVINAIDNYLSICVKSSMFFHLYLFTYNNCVKKEIRDILLNKFIKALSSLKSLYHEEIFRILKYNNKINYDESENGDTKNSDIKPGEENAKINKDNIVEDEEKSETASVTNEKGTDDNSHINMPFHINIEIIKYISKRMYEHPSHPTEEAHIDFLNFCYNLYLENNNILFIVELIGFLKKDQTLYIFNEIIKNEMDENKKIEILRACIDNIIKLPYSYIMEKKNENESYYITNIEIFYFYYNLNKNKNIQRIMLDYFVTKVNLNQLDDQENNKMANDITIKDIANIIQQLAENTDSIFPIYGRFLCQVTKNINILREFVSSIIIPLLIQKKIWTNKFIWKGCLMCISMLWPDFKHSLFYIFFMLPEAECTVLFNLLKPKYPIATDLVDLISTNEQAKRMCPYYLKNLLNNG